MFPIIEFNNSAFKHGLTEDNIRHVMWHPLHEQLLESYVNKWLIIGYDKAGSLVEVAYNIIDDDTVNVFHAMPCRKKYISQLNQLGRGIWLE
jgi:uncharacterized DUF497 family protein